MSVSWTKCNSHLSDIQLLSSLRTSIKRQSITSLSEGILQWVNSSINKFFLLLAKTNEKASSQLFLLILSLTLSSKFDSVGTDISDDSLALLYLLYRLSKDSSIKPPYLFFIVVSSAFFSSYLTLSSTEANFAMILTSKFEKDSFKAKIYTLIFWFDSSMREREESARGDWNWIYDSCYFFLLKVVNSLSSVASFSLVSFVGFSSGIKLKYSDLGDRFFR